MANQPPSTEIDSWGEPTDAAKQKDALIRDLVAALADRDAEIEHLKLEMDGVDNAKEEIGRLLGLTEEFRWKRISAAIHEQKRLIRELEQAVAFADDNRTFQIERAEKAEALIRELVAALDQARAFIDSDDTYGPRAVNLFSDVVGALARAKAAGFEP
jgi:hypothetical protein